MSPNDCTTPTCKRPPSPHPSDHFIMVMTYVDALICISGDDGRLDGAQFYGLMHPLSEMLEKHKMLLDAQLEWLDKGGNQNLSFLFHIIPNALSNKL